MDKPSNTQATDDDRAFVERVAQLLKEAVGVADDKKCQGELERILSDYIAGTKKPPEPKPPPVATTAAELAIVPDDPAPVPIVASAPEGLSLEPLLPKPVVEERDPTRPDFGQNQVSSPDRIRAGMKLRVRGAPKATLECHAEKNIRVKDIINAKNPEGEVTVVSAPFDEFPSKRKIIIVSYMNDPAFTDSKICTSRIYLDELGVTQYKPKGSNDRGGWRVEAWLEWIPE